tara:strand:+ start:2025 stop:2234 length:210 start_codon:yes stop_codon:yes gene_type:complete
MSQTYDDDPEPERYYEWMLWKMRKERAFDGNYEDIKLELPTHVPIETRINKLEKEIEELKSAVIQLQKQ